MKFSSVFGLVALAQASSAFFLQIKDPELAAVAYIRIAYRYLGASAGYAPDAPYMGVVVNKSGGLTSTADLGSVYFKPDEYHSEKGWYRSAFSNLEAPAAGDIKGPFAVESGKLVYKGTDKWAWTMCPDSGGDGTDHYFDLYITTGSVKPPFGCTTNIDLSVPQI